MERKIAKKRWVILFVALLSIPTFVRAADYEEVSYDDLVNQLSSRKNATMLNANDPLDALKIHLGFGLTSAASNISAGGSSSYRYMNGFQLAAGIDLFSSHWMAQGVLRNFGQSSTGNENRSLREYDLNLLYSGMMASSLGYHLGGGFGTRSLKISDSAKGYSINDTTPVTVLVGGLDIPITPVVGFGIELGLHTAMVTSTADKSSGDLTLHVDASF
jgi:hypothetical protein